MRRTGPTSTERDGSTSYARANASTRPGERRPAPAARRTRRRVGTAHLDGPGDHGCDAADVGGERLRVAVRAPVEDEMRRVGIERCHPAPSTAPAARNTPLRVRPDGARTNGTRSTLASPSPPVGGSSSRSIRIWEVGASTPGRSRASFESSRGRQRPEPFEQTLDEVDLRLSERCVEPHAPRRDAVTLRGVEDVAARRARHVRVVEDDPAGTRGQRSSSASASPRREPPRSSRLSRT